MSGKQHSAFSITVDEKILLIMAKYTFIVKQQCMSPIRSSTGPLRLFIIRNFFCLPSIERAISSKSIHNANSTVGEPPFHALADIHLKDIQSRLRRLHPTFLR